MSLGRAEDGLAADLGDRLDDVSPAAHEVAPAHPQRGQLTEAHAGIGEEEDHRAVDAGRIRELLDLTDGEEHALLPERPRKRHAIGRVAREPSVAHGERQDQREHAMGLAHRGRRETRPRQLADPGRDALVRDVRERDGLPSRQHVDAQEADIPRAVRRLMSTLVASQRCDQSPTVIRARPGSTYMPLVTAVVTSSSQCWASILRGKCWEYSLPAASR